MTQDQAPKVPDHDFAGAVEKPALPAFEQAVETYRRAVCRGMMCGDSEPSASTIAAEEAALTTMIAQHRTLQAEVERLRGAAALLDRALAEAEAILGGEYAIHYGPLFDMASTARAAMLAQNLTPRAEEERFRAENAELKRPDIFWDAAEPDSVYENIHDAIEYADHDEIIPLLCAKSLPNGWGAWRCTSLDEDGSPDFGEPEFFSSEEEARRSWSDSVAKLRTTLQSTEAEKR